jgi:hypothetical protein
MRTIIRNILILLALGIFGLFPFTSASAHTMASGNGTITGRLLDGSNKNAPLAGESITLQMAQGSKAQDVTSAKTDSRGIVVFDHLATDKTITYVLYIKYQGAQYVSKQISLAGQNNQQVDLTVYEATTSSAKVALVNTTLLMRDPNAHNGTFTVSAIYAFKNLDTHAYVGSLDASKGNPNALLFPLPPGAKNVKLNDGFDGYNVIQVNNGFASDAALPPGDSEFAFSFDVPYSGSTYVFNYAPLYPTVSLSFLVPPDIHVSAQGLSSQGLVTGNDQHQYQNFTAAVLRPQQGVQLDLEGLTTQTSTPQVTPLKLGNIWLIIGLLILIAILLVSAVIYRMQQGIWLPWKRGSQRRKRGKYSSERSKHHDGHHKSKKDELLHELLELDKAHDAGKISKSVYNERRAKTKARLRALMSEREESRR